MRGGLRARVLGAVLTLAGSAAADPNAARQALARGDLEGAARALQTPRPSQGAAADLVRARIAYEVGRYEEAVSHTARVRVRGMRAEALTLEGEALAMLGRNDEALACWRTAMEVGPFAGAWRAHARAAQWLARCGRGDEAREAANPLLDAYNDAGEPEGGPAGARGALLRDPRFLTSVALAAQALGHPSDANRALNEALRAAPDDVEANLAQAELMRVTEDYGPAGEAVQAALRVNARSPWGLVLRARLRLLSGHDAARARDDLDAAAAVNPRIPLAFALRASIALRDGDAVEAARQLALGEAVNPRDLDLLAMRGALRFVAGDAAGARQCFDAAHALAPAWTDGYGYLAEAAEWEHRYDEAAELLREAVARPAVARDRRVAARVRAHLGANLLRMGREAEAVEVLRASFEGSRFNVRVANLLNFYETVVPRDYVTEDEGPFRLRYHREEHAILRRHVPALLRRAYDDMVQRYGFTPEGPLSIELYARDEDFSVRTAGVPEIGVQGVCFGRVVTALSPRGGPYNWAQIVWHELAHVFAVQRSRSRVPRWFTEGLSEWESFHRFPRWAREEDPALWRALRAGRVPSVASFNHAFTHARSGEDMTVAYYAASQLVAFMIERYGFARVASTLPLWAEGIATTEVIQRALGVSADALDAAFRAHLAARLARYDRAFDVDPAPYRDRAAREAAARARPDDADAQAAAAMACLVAGDAAAAAPFAERAIRIEGAHPLARWVRAALALGAEDPRAALREVDAILEGAHEGYELRALEARAARGANDARREERALEAAMRADPTQAEAPRRLAAIRARQGRDDDRARLLRAVVDLDQHDRASLAALLDLLVARGRWAEVRTLAEHAVQLDPERAGTHLAIAQAAQETGAMDEAVRSFEDAALVAPSLAAAVRERVAAIRAGRRGMPPISAEAPATR